MNFDLTYFPSELPHSSVRTRQKISAAFTTLNRVWQYYLTSSLQNEEKQWHFTVKAGGWRS